MDITVAGTEDTAKMFKNFATNRNAKHSAVMTANFNTPASIFSMKRNKPDSLRFTPPRFSRSSNCIFTRVIKLFMP